MITAGAGMGVDSGLPDFRGPQGFWGAYPAVAKLGLSFEEIASPAWFKKDPSLAWAFYGHRLNRYRATVPHDGFHRLLQIALTKPAGYFVFTSNVDWHFQKAGFEPERIVEVHGSIHHLQCVDCCSNEIWDGNHETVVIDEVAFRTTKPWPRCGHCAGLARPNILMFGDWCWLGHRTERQQQKFSEWLRAVAGCRAKLVVIELGAGSAIPTVRYTSEAVAQRFNGRLIRINPREDAVPLGQFGLPLGASEAVHQLCAQ